MYPGIARPRRTRRCRRSGAESRRGSCPGSRHSGRRSRVPSARGGSRSPLRASLPRARAPRRPRVGSVMRLMILSSVDLPAPFRPMMPTDLPTPDVERDVVQCRELLLRHGVSARPGDPRPIARPAQVPAEASGATNAATALGLMMDSRSSAETFYFSGKHRFGADYVPDGIREPAFGLAEVPRPRPNRNSTTTAVEIRKASASRCPASLP